jgi:hypothetical protein
MKTELLTMGQLPDCRSFIGGSAPPVIMTDDGSALLSSSGAKSAAKSSQRTSVANLIAQLTLRVL